MRLSRTLLMAAFCFCLITAQLSATPIQTQTFTFSFGAPSSPFRDSGLLMVRLTAPDVYQIYGISGLASLFPNQEPDQPITGIVPLGVFINDNLILKTGPGAYTLDSDGLAYTIGSGFFTSSVYVYQYGGLYYESEDMRGNEPVNHPYEQVRFNLHPLYAAATPEPSSFALLGTGLLGIAGFVRKRLADRA